MSGETFSDASMLEIFRAEVETHVEILTSGLLALERDPEDTSHIDEMMRGAHSIKGAARIVGIDPAVRVAHVMEDGFVAAQNGKLKLRPDHVDVLLRGVDMLNRIAAGSKLPNTDWTQYEAESTPLVKEIVAVLAAPAAPAEISPPGGELPPAPIVSQKRNANKIEPATIRVASFLDAGSAEMIRVQVVAAVDANASTIMLDLTDTVDLDATGLALLASIPVFAQKHNSRAEFTNASAELQQVLAATGLDRLYQSGGR